MDTSTVGIVGIGGILAMVIGFVWKLVRPAGPSRGDRPSARPLGPLENVARRAQAEAAKKREMADDEAIREVGSRPHTDDPVRDLGARLGATRPNHGNGDGPEKPAT